MSKSPPPETVGEQEEEVIEWLYLDWLAFSNFVKAKVVEHFSQTRCELHGRKKPPRVILIPVTRGQMGGDGSSAWKHHSEQKLEKQWLKVVWRLENTTDLTELQLEKPVGEASEEPLKIQERKSPPQISSYSSSSNQVRSLCHPSIL